MSRIFDLRFLIFDCVRTAVICLSAVILTALPARANGYLAAVESAAGLLVKGRYIEAQQAFRQAREMDMNDPLAAVGIGYALESDGQPAAARIELRIALQLDAKNKAGLWALALSSLNGGELDNARRQLEALRDSGGQHLPDLWICLAYVRCAAGDYAGAQEALGQLGDIDALAPRQRSVARLVAGAAACATQKYAPAAEALRLAAFDLPATGFTDRVQRRRAPILPDARPAHVEPPPLVSSEASAPQARTISGTVRLRLDRGHIPNATYAAFIVDGKTLYTTNVEPFTYDWDSRRTKNGYHKLIIRGVDSYGQVLGEVAEVVLLRNEGDAAASDYPPAEYTRAEETLRRAMVLQPDVLATHYLLGLSLLRQGDLAGAAASLEVVVGYDPTYGAARKELLGIFARANGSRIRAVSSVPTTARKIAITFDDGPNPLYTPPLLDALERHKARCTMFLVGTQAEAFPDIVREMVEKGHEIANHTYSHPNLKTLDQQGVEVELMRCRSVLRRITGKSTELFRPPGGNVDRSIGDICVAYGFTTVYWDVFDSWLQQFDESTVLTRLVTQIKPGSIILLHNGNNKTARIVEPLLEEMTRQGYQMVTVSELLAERTAGAPLVSPPTQEAPELRDDDPVVPQIVVPGRKADAPVRVPMRAR